MKSDKYIPVSLPSRCIPYEGINSESIKIRSFKGREQELMATLNMPNLSKRLLTVLENVLQGIKVKDLTSGDAEFVMLWEAINSYSNLRSINLVCSDCEENITIDVDLLNLEKLELSDDYKDKKKRIVKLSTGDVELRVLTLQDEIEAYEYSKKVTDASSYLYTYACSIVNGRGVLENRDALEKADAQDVQQIIKFQEKYKHGVNLESKFVCPKCKKEGILKLPFRLEVFFPVL